MASLTFPVKVFALAANEEETAKPEITIKFNRRNSNFRTSAFITDFSLWAGTRGMPVAQQLF
jgi:hypothetical protein